MRNKKELILYILTAITLVVVVIYVISINKYKVETEHTVEPIKNSGSNEIPTYTADEFASIAGDIDSNEKVMLIGYMCNEVGVDTSAAWITEHPFQSKDSVQSEVRIDTGDVIAYTPMAIGVIGNVEKIDEIDGDEQKFKIANASIYIYYAEDDSRYSKFNSIITEGVMDTAMEIFAAGSVDENNISKLESAIQVCNELGEVELSAVLNELSASENDIENLYEKFRAILIEH